MMPIKPAPGTLAVLLLGVLAGGCSRTADSSAVTETPAVRVEVTEATLRTHTVLQPVAGTLRPPTVAVLAARTSATVASASFAVGQAVATGDPLVRLDAPEVLARRERAEALVAQITRSLMRERTLLEAGISTIDTVRNLEDELRVARAGLAEASALVDQLDIRAPFSGTISRRHANAGDSVLPGTPLLEIESDEPLRAEVELPDSLPALPLGTPVFVEISGNRIPGRLEELASAADTRSRTRTAKVSLTRETQGLRSGQFIRVLWPSGEIPRVTLPSSSISQFGQMERVFIVESGVARMRLVRTAPIGDGHVAIQSGLQGGEWVILNPPAGLRDGARVEVAR
jgi:RND family efflux transporter MFP subunit